MHIIVITHYLYVLQHIMCYLISTQDYSSLSVMAQLENFYIYNAVEQLHA